MNADVLWISDFKIPLSVPELTDKMLEYRKVDTHFYGLQLGIAENEWSPFFDRIYRIDYTPSRVTDCFLEDSVYLLKLPPE